jgi:hypothetical protein
MPTHPNTGMTQIGSSGVQERLVETVDENFGLADVLFANLTSSSPAINSLLGWTFDSAMAVSTNTPAAATIYLGKILVPVNRTITNVLVGVQTAGTSYTNTQVGLYSSAGVLLGASTVRASAGTDTFGSTGVKTLALTTAQAVVGSPTAYVWAALHMGTNSATAAIFRASAAVAMHNAGLAAAALRAASQTGHATNPLATIGNLTPASNVAADTPIWFGVS